MKLSRPLALQLLSGFSACSGLSPSLGAILKRYLGDTAVSVRVRRRINLSRADRRRPNLTSSGTVELRDTNLIRSFENGDAELKRP